MNIFITRGNRANRPFLLTIEDKSLWTQERIDNNDANVSDLVTGYSCTCTQQNFDTINDIVGTLEAPALIANANATPYQNRINCYIENNSLKILAQS